MLLARPSACREGGRIRLDFVDTAAKSAENLMSSSAMRDLGLMERFVAEPTRIQEDADMTRRIIGLLIVVGVVALTVQAAAVAMQGKATRQAGVVSLGVATGTLVRTDNGVSVTIQAAGLTPGNVYSAWWFGAGAVPPKSAGGRVASGAGTATFSGNLLEGANLIDARKDTVIVRILNHGPEIPGSIRKQMTSSGFGAAPCNGNPGSCPPAITITFAP